MSPRPEPLKDELGALAARAREAALAMKQASPESRSFVTQLETPRAKEAALVQGAPVAPLVHAAQGGLAAFRAEICECQLCPLSKSRKKFVFGEGDPEAKLVFLGPAPDADDDLAGRPLAGAPGQLFERILKAMNLRRDQVYLLNLVKCRPPLSRPVEQAEFAACAPFWRKQIAMIKPKALCALGDEAASALKGRPTKVSEAPGRFFEWEGLPAMATYHPAQVLKNEGLKRQVWDDMKALLKKLETAI